MNRQWTIVAVAFVAAVAVDLALGATPPGFIAALGFVGCWVMVLGSKELAKRLLKRPDAYYAATDHPEVRDDAA